MRGDDDDTSRSVLFRWAAVERAFRSAGEAYEYFLNGMQVFGNDGATHQHILVE